MEKNVQLEALGSNSNNKHVRLPQTLPESLLCFPYTNSIDFFNCLNQFESGFLLLALKVSSRKNQDGRVGRPWVHLPP